MRAEITELELADFPKCGEIRDMSEQSELACQFYAEMQKGIRKTYIYKLEGGFIGEISVVSETDDPDYTVVGERLYISRLIVKEGYRSRGIGRRLLDYVIEKASEEGFIELSVGVDLDNYAALRLYHSAGFDRILYVGEDKWGRYMKLLKRL